MFPPCWSVSARCHYGARWATHHSLHDLAVLRAINNLAIIVPADNFSTSGHPRRCCRNGKPVFVRFGEAAMYMHKPETKLTSLKPSRCAEATTIAFLAIAETVIHALSRRRASPNAISGACAFTFIQVETGARLASHPQASAGDTKRSSRFQALLVHGPVSARAVALHAIAAGRRVTFRIVGIPMKIRSRRAGRHLPPLWHQRGGLGEQR